MKCKVLLEIFSFIFGLALVYSPLAKAEEDYVIKFGMVEHNPYFYKEDGRYVGYAVEDMKRICEIVGYKFESRAYPPLRLIRYLQMGEIDVAFLPTNLGGIEGLERADTPISIIDYGFYHPKKIKTDAANLDLNNKTLIVVKKHNYCGFLDVLKERFPTMTVVEASTIEATFKMLEYGRGDLLIAYKQIVEHMDIDTGDLIYRSQDKSDIVMIFSQSIKYHNSSVLKRKLNKANRLVAAQENFVDELNLR